MADKVEVKAKAKTVNSDKTKKQDEELAKARKRKEEADISAKKASEERIKEEEKARKEKEKKAKEAEEKRLKEAEELAKKKQDKTKETIQGVATIAAATLAASGNKKKGFLSGLLVGLVAGVALTFMFNSWLSTAFTNPVEHIKDDFDEILTETFAGYTAVDFTNAVLGEASQHQELIVMEQPLEIETTITKSGLGGWEIFSKTKDLTYAGTGVYTVDLKDIDEEHINVDIEEKVVTVYINHSVLQYVNLDYDNMKFEDTEKGLLSFGDITLTLEQQNTLEKSVQDSMREVLLKDTLLKQADEFAKMKTWEIFQPLVSAVSPEFRVEIEFNK